MGILAQKVNARAALANGGAVQGATSGLKQLLDAYFRKQDNDANRDFQDARFQREDARHNERQALAQQDHDLNTYQALHKLGKSELREPVMENGMQMVDANDKPMYSVNDGQLQQYLQTMGPRFGLSNVPSYQAPEPEPGPAALEPPPGMWDTVQQFLDFQDSVPSFTASGSAPTAAPTAAPIAAPTSPIANQAEQRPADQGPAGSSADFPVPKSLSSLLGQAEPRLANIGPAGSSADHQTQALHPAVQADPQALAPIYAAAKTGDANAKRQLLELAQANPEAAAAIRNIASQSMQQQVPNDPFAALRY